MQNKKMSDVFATPVRLHEEWNAIFCGKKLVLKPNWNFEDAWKVEAEAAVHAINNHDALIEQLASTKARLAELEAEHSWRDAITDPPSKSGLYLCWCDNEKYKAIFVQAKTFDKKYGWNDGDVTHWRPMPEPPATSKCRYPDWHVNAQSKQENEPT